MGAVRTELWCRVAGPWSGVGRHRGACEQHNRQRRGGERGVQRRGKAGGGELDHVPVGEPLLAADRDGPATQLAHRRGRGLQDKIYATGGWSPCPTGLPPDAGASAAQHAGRGPRAGAAPARRTAIARDEGRHTSSAPPRRPSNRTRTEHCRRAGRPTLGVESSAGATPPDACPPLLSGRRHVTHATPEPGERYASRCSPIWMFASFKRL